MIPTSTCTLADDLICDCKRHAKQSQRITDIRRVPKTKKKDRLIAETVCVCGIEHAYVAFVPTGKNHKFTINDYVPF